MWGAAECDRAVSTSGQRRQDLSWVSAALKIGPLNSYMAK